MRTQLSAGVGQDELAQLIADASRAGVARLFLHGDPTRDITATGNVVEVWRRGVRQPR